jgi:hypothetical protein
MILFVLLYLCLFNNVAIMCKNSCMTLETIQLFSLPSVRVLTLSHSLSPALPCLFAARALLILLAVLPDATN